MNKEGLKILINNIHCSLKYLKSFCVCVSAYFSEKQVTLVDLENCYAGIWHVKGRTTPGAKSIILNMFFLMSFRIYCHRFTFVSINYKNALCKLRLLYNQ